MAPLPLYARVAYFLLMLLGVGFLVIYTQEILKPIVFALLFAFLLLRPTCWLEKRGFPAWLAALLSVLGMVAITVGLAWFMFTQVASFADNWDMMKVKINQRTAELQTYIAKNTPWNLREQKSWLKENTETISDSGGQYALTLFSFTGALLAKMLIIPILVFFMLVYRERVRTFISVVGKHYQWYILEVMGQLVSTTQYYLRGLMLDILILAVLNSIGFLLLGIPYAILLGALAAILNIVPYVGVLVGSLLPVLMALVTRDNGWIAVGAFGVCAFVQFLDNNFITPKVVGSSVSINPLAALLALLVGNLIWGVTGMILAIPVTGMVKVVLDNVPSLRPYGYLLGEDDKYAYGPPMSDKQSIVLALRNMLERRFGRKTRGE